MAQVTVYGSEREITSEPIAEEALRTAMASCVRFHCPPDSVPSLERGSAQLPQLTMPNSQCILLDFQSPQDVPTALPLPGWFGPLRGSEEMRQVERLCIILQRGRWAEVIAHHADSTWSCWKSNRESELLLSLGAGELK